MNGEKCRFGVLGRLEDEDSPFAAKLAKCGTTIALACCCCGAVKDAPVRCDLKWCPSCQPAIAASHTARYAPACARLKWPMIANFTVTHTEDDPPTLLRDMMVAHQKMRRHRWWKSSVAGGICSWEVTRLTWEERKARGLPLKETGWHPHGHSVVDSRWLDQELASDVWAKSMGRRGCAWVKRLGGSRGERDSAVRETLKYSVKGNDLLHFGGELTPILDVISSKRLVVAFGSFRGIAAAEVRTAKAKCETCGVVDPGWLPDAIYRKQRDGQRKDEWEDLRKRNRKSTLAFKAKLAALPAKSERQKYVDALNRAA